jgi:hypothetical protein
MCIRDRFNIAEDPSEQRDLSGQRPEVLTRLKEQMAALASEAAPPNIPPNRPPAGFNVPEVWGQ